MLSPSMVDEVHLLAKIFFTNVAFMLKSKIYLFLGQLTLIPLLLMLQSHVLVEVLPLVEGA